MSNQYGEQAPPYGQQYGNQQYANQQYGNQYAQQQQPQFQQQYQQQPQQYQQQQNQQQQYQNQQQPKPQHSSLADLIPKKDDRFKPSSYKDLWAAILFILTLLGFAVLSGVVITSLRNSRSNGVDVGISPVNIAGILVTSVVGILVLI